MAHNHSEPPILNKSRSIIVEELKLEIQARDRRCKSYIYLFIWKKNYNIKNKLQAMKRETQQHFGIIIQRIRAILSFSGRYLSTSYLDWGNKLTRECVFLLRILKSQSWSFEWKRKQGWSFWSWKNRLSAVLISYPSTKSVHTIPSRIIVHGASLKGIY